MDKPKDDTDNKNNDNNDNNDNNENNDNMKEEVPSPSPSPPPSSSVNIIPTDIEQALSNAKLCIKNDSTTTTARTSSNDEDNTNIDTDTGTKYNKNNNIVTAYYLDSSGRAPLKLTIIIKCNDAKDTIILYKSGLFSSSSANDNDNNSSVIKNENMNFILECHPILNNHTVTTSTSCSATVTTIDNDVTNSVSNGNVSVEYVSIKSSKVMFSKEEQPSHFELDVEMMTQAIIDTTNEGDGNDCIPNNTAIDESLSCPSPIITNLEIRATIKRKIVLHSIQQKEIHIPALYYNTSSLLESLELGGSIISPLQQHAQNSNNNQNEQYGVRNSKSYPLLINVNLVKALNINVKEIGGARAASGATLVSLTIEHSNQHSIPIVISNIALHPGHSRLFANNTTTNTNTTINTNTNATTNSITSHNNLLNTNVESSSSSNNNNITNRSNINRTNRSMQGGESAVIDMSHYCTWGYAQGTAPKLPIILYPHEAISTVLQIDAWEEHYGCRTFLSPISVTSHCYSEQHQSNDYVNDNVDKKNTSQKQEQQQQFILSTYCKWTTARIAFSEQPVDAFRIDMSLIESKFFVGAPFVVYLQVLNLSQDDRDLMLLMAKDEEGKSTPTSYSLLASNNNNNLNYAVPSSSSNATATSSAGINTATTTATTTATAAVPVNTASNNHLDNNNYQDNNQDLNTASRPSTMQQQQQHHSVNTAVVSEVNGYTFGVWGLAGEDDGTIRHNRDHELLAVDAALLLGEVKGQHTIQAELRFVPLREGTLDVPNLKLYDKLGGRWYDCVHMLKIVASAN